MGSPFTGLLCRVAGQNLDRRTEAGRRMLDWPGDPDGWADGLPLRLCGGLHALVRRGSSPELASCYPPNPLPVEERLRNAIDAALDRPDLLAWLDSPPQTNEVGRANALMSGLLVVAERFRKPIRLFELGASAGLNLVLDRYGYDLGGTIAGDPASPLQLKPEWTGAAPPRAAVKIAQGIGVDINPMDVRGDRERLLAYVWADQRWRIGQLETALDLAADNPPPVEQGDAASWVETNVSVEPVAGVVRVVMHSVAWQYFPAEAQSRIAHRMAQAGANASAEAPLAWLRFEKEPADKQTSLRLALWPSGEDILLAYCHAHGSAIEWLSAPGC
jgi:hypothetical protein